MKHVEAVVKALVDSGAHVATKYVTERQIVRATRRLYHRRRFAKAAVEITLTIGRPNYAERKFIAKCKKAGESLPVKKVQLKFPPKKRA